MGYEFSPLGFRPSTAKFSKAITIRQATTVPSHFVSRLSTEMACLSELLRCRLEKIKAKSTRYFVGRLQIGMLTESRAKYDVTSFDAGIRKTAVNYE